MIKNKKISKQYIPDWRLKERLNGYLMNGDINALLNGEKDFTILN